MVGTSAVPGVDRFATYLLYPSVRSGHGPQGAEFGNNVRAEGTFAVLVQVV